MQTRIIALLAVSLLTGPLLAHAIDITIDGKTFKLNSVNVSASEFPSDLSVLTASMPWWGDSDLAFEFAISVGADLGFPNSGAVGPYFAWALNLEDVSVYSFSFTDGQVVGEIKSTSEPFAYATAQPVSLPEPGSLALLCLGLAGLGLTRKRTGAGPYDLRPTPSS